MKQPTLQPGVVYGDTLAELLAYSVAVKGAFPFFNCGFIWNWKHLIKAASEAGVLAIGLQASFGGSASIAGPKWPNESDSEHQVRGSIEFMESVTKYAEGYGVSVVLGFDHSRPIKDEDAPEGYRIKDWSMGVLAYAEKFYAEHGKPPCSFIMIDASQDEAKPKANIIKEAINHKLTIDFAKQASKFDIFVEGESGINLGEEDGEEGAEGGLTVTTPENISAFVQAAIDADVVDRMWFAPIFGNRHGAYPKVKGDKGLQPDALPPMVTAVSDMGQTLFVKMHGGSDTADDLVQDAIRKGNIFGINVDTDLQGRAAKKTAEYVEEVGIERMINLTNEIPDPENSDETITQNNKSVRDPRKWLNGAVGGGIEEFAKETFVKFMTPLKD